MFRSCEVLFNTFNAHRWHTVAVSRCTEAKCFTEHKLVDGAHRRDPRTHGPRTTCGVAYRVRRAVGKSALLIPCAIVDSDTARIRLVEGRRKLQRLIIAGAGDAGSSPACDGSRFSGRVTAGAIPVAGAGELTFIGFKRGLNSVRNSVANACVSGVTGGESAAQLLTRMGAEVVS